jgi:hypothetical protein
MSSCLGLEAVHPLVAIHKYCYKYDEYYLPEGKVAYGIEQNHRAGKATFTGTLQSMDL